MPKWLIVILIVLGILGILVFLIYWKFWGITKKQKYEKCAKTCEELMLLESDIAPCKAKCVEITNYSPTSESKSTTTTTSQKTVTPDTSKQYSCNYVWPQEIVEKDSKALTLVCPSARPWCRPGEGSYEDISCCADYSEITKEKTDCLKLPELLKK